jgi:hypothetical protein
METTKFYKVTYFDSFFYYPILEFIDSEGEGCTIRTKINGKETITHIKKNQIV